jgi:hypothetical protein
MASQVDVANLALSILGKPSIASFADNSNSARVINIEYDLIRRALLTGRATWRFSVARASLPVLSTAPVSGPYTQQYALPSDCLRVLLAGDTWPGMDLSDYLMGPTDAGYEVEGRNILCDYGSPLSLQYVSDVTDTTQFDPWFVVYLAAEIAWTCCERLTGSDAKQQAAKLRKDDAMVQATASNALVNTPHKNADDTWVLARMQ